MTFVQTRFDIRRGPLATVTALVGLAVCLPAPAGAATVQFSDADFNLPDYAITNYAQPGYDTVINQNGEILGTDFNLYFNYSYGRTGANPAGNRLQAFNSSFVYNPQASGAITSLDATLDQRNFLAHDGTAVSLATAPSSLRVLALQDGNIYRSTTFGPAIGAQGVWYATSASGLLASNFGLFDPANPNAALGGTGLDFGGSAITFGFELAPFGIVRSDGSPITGRSSAAWQADNFHLTVNAADLAPGVPEPSAWALLILGFGIVGVGMRARRRFAPTLAPAIVSPRDHHVASQSHF